MLYKSALIYLLTATIGMAGCTSGKKAETDNQEIPVRTTTVGYDKREAWQEYVGVAEEEFSSAISFSTNGTIERMHVVEGQQVAKGTLLAELNTSNLVNTYTAAKAMLDQAEDAMKRIQMLYENESVPEIKYIEIKTELEKAKSTEAIAKKSLVDSRLIAPFSGIIGEKRVEAGENVLPNQTAFTLLKIDRAIMIKVAIPEKEISHIQLNQPASVKVAALNDELFEGMVAKKGVVADPLSHTYNVKVKVDNTAMKLLPGMVCNINIHSLLNEKEVIVIPNNSVQRYSNGEKYVWRVVNGNAIRQPVATGKLTSNGVEITSGLQGGEEIITEGYQGLFDGATIRIL